MKFLNTTRRYGYTMSFCGLFFGLYLVFAFMMWDFEWVFNVEVAVRGLFVFLYAVAALAIYDFALKEIEWREE